MDINPESVAKSPFFIGLLGSFVALRGAPGLTWRERAFNLVSGTLLAGYLSPALVEYFHLTTPATQSAAAFVIGLFGLNLTAAVVEHIRAGGFNSLLPGSKKE